MPFKNLYNKTSSLRKRNNNEHEVNLKKKFAIT